MEDYLEYQAAQASFNSTQLSQARALWVHQLEVRQELIDAATTNGNNSKTNPEISQDTTWVSTFDRTEVGPSGSDSRLYSPTNLLGTPDGNCAEFLTPSSGDVASDVCQMSGNSAGTVNFYGALGPTGAGKTGNYIVIEVSNDLYADMSTWIAGFVGYAQVTTNNIALYTVGMAPEVFNYISVGAVVMEGPPQYPFPNTQDLYNDVLVDAVYATGGIGTLTLSSGDGGYTTSPVPEGYQVSSGTYLYPLDLNVQVQVEAIPNSGYTFNNWNLDGSNVGSTNPFSVTMNTDHSLDAVFASTTQYAWLYVNTCDQIDNPLNANIYVDNNWIGCGSGSVYLPLGQHTISSDSSVWDDYYGTYVFPVSGDGPITLTSDTSVTVYYSY